MAHDSARHQKQQASPADLCLALQPINMQQCDTRHVLQVLTIACQRQYPSQKSADQHHNIGTEGAAPHFGNAT